MLGSVPPMSSAKKKDLQECLIWGGRWALGERRSDSAIITHPYMPNMG